jgi:hypothetical protein
MTARTPQEAAEWLCPHARTFAAPKAEPHCQGPLCALWRWQELSADILTPHVKARRADAGDDLKSATAWVMENREALGIPTKPTHGYCGGGGQP